MAAIQGNLGGAAVEPGKRLIDGEVVANLISGGRGGNTQDAITPSTTQTQAGGQLLDAVISVVNAGNASDALRMPKAAASMVRWIVNDSGQTLQIFPAVGDFINDAAVDAAVTIANNTLSVYVAGANGKWFGGPITLET
jgi:hypothetical protein